MKRYGLSIALVAACSSGAGKHSTTGGSIGTTHEGSTTGSKPGATASADPNLAFRLGYSNAGGMWLPQQMELPGHVETFQKMGVAIPASTLANPLAAPLAAVVSIGGCTASFVSPEGLVITNHHCVQGALQLNSTPEKNLVEDGFLARTRAEEPSAGPAQRVMVAQAFTDVTTRMREGLDKIKDPNARKDELEKREKTLVAACEKSRPGIRCQVTSFFRGGLYLQIENLEIRDVRLVYVPARAIGNYGGEIDNWAWPRHTGDFSFYRAYVGKDGKPADYSPDNVPYKPAHFLKVSDQGVQPGDFVMVTGYPGRTSRTEMAVETHHKVEWAYPYQIAYYKERYAIAEKYANAKDAGETAIKANVLKQSIQNGLEKTEGVLKGLTSGDLLARKDQLDKQVKQWAAQPGHETHKAAIERYEQLILDQIRTARVDFDRSIAFGGSRLLSTALTLNRWAEERVKSDPDRRAGFQERDMPRMLAGQKQFLKQYDATLDRATFRLALVRALQLPQAERPWLGTLLGTKQGAKLDEALIDKTLDGWYAQTKLTDEKVRIDLLQKGTTKQLASSKDPFIKAALRIWPTYKAEEKKSEAEYGEELLVAPLYVDAMRQAMGGLLAPDANSTLRITYGTVKSFKPGSKEPADLPFTLASQIPQKDTGKDPFDAPAAELAAIKQRKYGTYADPALGGELPVDFLTDLDITGGNSGSPTLNRKGELVGLAFDGTIEGVASDVVFNGASTRVIHVDARYMLWTMDLLDGADHLLTEMGVKPRL